MPVKAKAKILLNELRDGMAQASEELKAAGKDDGLKGFSRAFLEGMGHISKGIFSSGRVAGAREAIGDLTRRAVTPEFLEEKVSAANRAGQVVALFFVPILVIVSLALIVAMNQLMSEVFGGWSPADSQVPIFGFFVTALTLGMLIFAAWTWFQFVRTAGLGMFAWED